MEYLIIWLIALIAVASLTAYCASQKGRNPVTWLLLGLLFAFLALIAVLMLPTLSDDEISKDIAKKTGSSSKHRTCPFCAEVVLLAAAKCKHCKSDLEPTNAIEPTYPAEDDNPLDGKLGEYLPIACAAVILVSFGLYVMNR